jgi:hypothetical protein
MPVGGAAESVFPIATIATLLRQMDAIDAGAATPATAAATVTPAAAAVSSAASLLGNLSAALRGTQPPIMNPLAMPMSAGPVFMPRGVSQPQPVPAASASLQAVFPHQLLEVLQPTLENAKRVPNDSARIAAINLRTLVDIYTRQVNAAAGRASPPGPSATLYQRLLAHRQGAPLELSDLMSSIVPGWTPPVVTPSSSSANANANAAASRKRAHGTGVTNLPDNLGLLRAGGAGVPMPQLQQQQQQRAMTGAMMDPARAKAMEAIERAREKRHRTDLERHHAPTEFSANYLKRCATQTIFVPAFCF